MADSPVGPGEPSGSLVAGCALILIAAAAHLALGVMALLGSSWLEANVLEIESNSDFGRLYLSLGGWGVILVALGVVELAGAMSALRTTTYGRLAALGSASAGLAGSFATLAIFRWASLAMVPVLMLAILLISRDDPDRSSPP